MKLHDVTAIVTGAGSGLGAATARLLARKGCHVALWDRNIEAATAQARYAGGLGIECDVTDNASIAAALAQTKAAFEPARIIVNCAGILVGRRVIARDGTVADAEHFHQTLQVNLIGTYNVMRLAAAAMKDAEPLDADGQRGVIINTASIAAFEGQIGQIAYAASKAGVVGMTLPAARDLAFYGIRVMCIAPGAMATPMMDGVRDENRASIAAGIPFPSRFARPEEFAKLVLHIADNDMLNGECIRLDGASRLAAK